MVSWSMYGEIQNLKRKGLKKAQVARKLNLNRETVTKYWNMAAEDFVICKSRKRIRRPDVYREIIIKWLKEYPDISAAQMYDWCKERNKLETLSFQKRSFQDYVNSIRAEYGISKPESARQYEAVDERTPGEQGQVDMGEIRVSTSNGGSKKIYCFAMVLMYSRYKYVSWQERPFNTDSFIQAHLKAFEFFGGRPKEIVYDQDKVLAVSENSGDIIYTTGFQNFVNEVKFTVFLCHGSDPESKGPIENVIKFAKHGFAKHRTFTDIESFNADCIAWLNRTANHDEHGTTHKRPDEAFATEREYLMPVNEYSFVPAVNHTISYPIRKDNIVIYKGNRYRVPVGTYHKGVRVFMQVNGDDDTVAITDTQSGEVYATHPLCHDKGKLIGYSDRSRRDTSKTLSLQEQELKNIFGDNELVSAFLGQVHKERNRYYRDQLGVIRGLFKTWSKEDILKGISYCSERGLYSAGDLKSSIIYLTNYTNDDKSGNRDGVNLPEKYRGDKPEVRPLNEYEDALA